MNRKERIKDRALMLWCKGEYSKYDANHLAKLQIDREDASRARANIDKPPQDSIENFFKWKTTPMPETLKA